MDSSSNGSLSNGNTKKRPSENGYCPSSSSVLLTYKTRKVSAVRDFPPGCGRNAPWINSRPQETAVALVVADKAADAIEVDGVKVSEIGVESISHEAVKSPVQVEKADSLDNLVAKVVATAGTVSGVEKLPSDVEPLGIELPKGLGNNTLESSKESDGVNDKALVKEELLEGEVQTSVKESSSSHELEIVTMVKTVGEPKNKTVLEVGALADGAVPMGSEKLWSPPQWSTTAANVPVGSGPMNKYPLRRVSATRDFPPFCGSNAPPPTEEDRLRVSGKKSLVVVEKVGVGSGVLGETLRAGVEGGTSRETVRDGGDESEGNARDGNVQKSESKDIVPEPRTKTHVRDVNVQKSEPKEEVPEPRKKTHVRDGNVQMSESREIVPEPRRKTHVQDGNDQKSESREIVPEPRKKTRVRDGNLQKSESKEIVSEPRKKTHVRDGNLQKSESKEIVSEPRKKTRTVMQRSNKDVGGPAGKVGKEIVLYSHDNDLKRKPLGDAAGLGQDMDRVIVQCLMAAPNCPWRQGRGAVTSPDDVMSRRKVKKRDFTGQEKSKLGASMNSHEANKSVGKSMKEKSKSAGKATYGGVGDLVVNDEEDYVVHDEELNEDSPAGRRSSDFSVSLPPFGPNSSNQGDARNRVRETLRLFQAICRKLLQGEEAKSRKGEEAKSKQPLRIDLFAAKIVRDKGKELNSGKQMLGAIPGVEVGDEFQYRVELAIVGIHRLYQAGIDYIKQGKKIVAASIVASGGYNDELDSADVLIYSGQGGNAAGRDKKAEDQKLERGNLALKNSIEAKNPVRVIRGSKETKASDSSDAKAKLVATYVYDGLYMVEKYWQEVGVHGKLVFKFELRRIPGQPELAWKELKKSRKFKTREGLCVNDISGGKELFPICAVNTIDNDEPPQFNYITRTIYPDQFLPVPPEGCDCTGVCMDSHRCSCAVKNGGEIPYNYNGAIVEAKPLVYECGPSCKCPPSCHNRVSQHGIKIHLEIFKTESRGWGVRSINSIPSGSFICEYIGELLEDKEAEQRTGNDEYLFDIGQNYNDCSHNPDEQSSFSEVVEDGGFTIDAAQFGNVGRFINHSCSPNLYAQNVLYDHVDKRIPHIMFFSAENIPPLQELTYHYNYSVDQVRDSNGNIKMKNCYCGSTECTGRMY